MHIRLRHEEEAADLGVNGSPHKDGIVCEILQSLLDAAADEGAEIQIIHLYDLSIRHAPGNFSKDPATEIVSLMPDDDMKKLYPLLEQADGIVFASPCYWANMSGAMKDFIDRLTALENENFALQRKVAACIAASRINEGGVATAALMMVMAITQMGMYMPPNGIMWYPGDWHKARETVKDFSKVDAPNVGRNMVRMIHALAEPDFVWSGEE